MRKLSVEQSVGEKPTDYVRRSRQVYIALKMIKGEKSSKIALDAGLCYSTVHKLRKQPKDGGTLFPRFSTMEKLLDAVGATLEVVKDGEIVKRW